jgi:hypothetical protein
LTYIGLLFPGFTSSDASLIIKTLFYCGFAAWFVRGYRKHYSPERQSKIYLWGVLLFTILPGLILLFAAPVVFTNYLILLSFPLPVIYLLAGTDWAEILDAIAQSVLKHAVSKVSSSWLAGIGIVLCSVFAASMMILSGGAAWKYLSAMVGALLFFAVVLWAAGIDENWGVHFSWAGMAILTAIFVLLITAVKRYSPMEATTAFWPVCFSILAASILILFNRLTKFAKLWPALLFGVLLGMFWAVINSQGQAPAATYTSGIMFGIAIASLVGIFGLLLLRGKGYDVRDAVFYTILFNIGCALLYVLAFGVYGGALKIVAQTQVIEAVVVFFAILWDILISGHSITNTDGKMFSRRSRVYLFFGYIMMVTATVVFSDSAVITQTGSANQIDLSALFRNLMNPELYVMVGIVSFGPATLLTLFLLRVTKWMPRRTNSSAQAHRS